MGIRRPAELIMYTILFTTGLAVARVCRSAHDFSQMLARNTRNTVGLVPDPEELR